MDKRTERWQVDSSTSDPEDQWQAILSETHLPWSASISRPQTTGFEATVSRWWVDDLALVDCTCMPCRGVRNRTELSETANEFAVLLITGTGLEMLRQDDVETVMRPGDALIWDGTRAAQFTVGKTLTKRSLLVPYAALDEIGLKEELSGGRTLDSAAASTRVLIAYLDTLPAALPKMEPFSVTALRNATLELLAAVVRPECNPADSSTARPALRAAMNRYIEAHLMDYNVTSAALAKAHGVSVRTVNRIFNANGQTVGKVVQLRRLARARDELVNSTRNISTIAHRWGFCDNSHFTRRFKAHYGMTPIDYRVDRVAHNSGGAPIQ